MADLDELARQSAVIQRCPERQSLVVAGPERLTWLDGLVTCELKTLSAGTGTWGLSLNRQGKIQTEIWAVEAADQLWISVAPGTREATRADLDRMLVMEDAELSLPDPDREFLALHGPEAGSLARALAERHEGASAAIDWLGIGGAALALPSGQAASVLRDEAVRVLSAEDWLRLRLERGFPVMGEDYGPRDRPHEAGLERRAVSWTKGCYLGQEVVCMQDMRGKVRRSNRVLSVDAPRDARLSAGQTIVGATDQPVGAISSAAYSSRAGAWLTMCRIELSAMDGPLGVTDADGSRHPARPAQPV